MRPLSLLPSSKPSLQSLGSLGLFTQPFTVGKAMTRCRGMAGEALAILLVSLLAVSGCQTPSVSTPKMAAGQATARSTTARASVRAGATYKQAVAAYRTHHYGNALRLVDALLARPDLSAQDKDFLLRQKQLCEAAVSGKPVNVTATAQTTSPGSTPDSTPRKLRTVSLSQRDCGPRALLILCQARHVPANLADLTRAAHTNSDGTSMEGLAAAAQTVGLDAKGIQVDKDAFARLRSPAIAWVDGNHYIAVLSVHDNLWTGKPSVTIHDPNHDGKEEMAQSDLLRRSGGILLTVAPKTLAKRQ